MDEFLVLRVSILLQVFRLTLEYAAFSRNKYKVKNLTVSLNCVYVLLITQSAFVPPIC